MFKVDCVNTTLIVDDPVRLVDVAKAEGQSVGNPVDKVDALWIPVDLEDLS